MIIDTSSDTVTKPCRDMRSLMANAEVADDTSGGDPTVTRLQNHIAEMLGKEAALFVPSGTQSNLIALLGHCQRGDEYIVGQQGHTYKYEGGGAAVLGSIQPQPIEFEKDGTLDLEKVESCIKPFDQHFAKTKLLCLENTLSGIIIPNDYIIRAGEFCKKHNLFFHLDGARLFHAVVESGLDAKDIAAPFDTISICLSKGLGAPVGSLLVGSSEFIERSKHWRKMLGGGMRQSGIIAAAGLYALQNNITRLKDDHEKAKFISSSLSHIKDLEIDEAQTQTNMVFVSPPFGHDAELVKFMKKKNIKITGEKRIRMVMHKDISHDDVKAIILAFEDYCEKKSP